MLQQGSLNSLPISLTHGDLLPHNILLDPQTWAITGYIDWAEAEPLPHGTNLYVLEHLLGYLDVSNQSRRPRFMYYAQAAELREVFWEEYAHLVPSCEQGVQTAVQVMRDAGCLLWHGFAWDDGRVDRVVNEVDDAEELASLGAFLRVELTR